MSEVSVSLKLLHNNNKILLQIDAMPVVRAGLRVGATGQLLRAPRCKGAPRDEIYLFQIKYSFEKFRNSEAIQEYNSILYSYVALSIKVTIVPNSN